MATSPNYQWAEPDNSSLVKNGAQDIRALGDAIDTSVWNIGFGQAGKNKFLNSDSSIWQRGTSFTAAGYTADRWYVDADTTSYSVSRQNFTAGTAPVAGYESQYFTRLVRGTGGSFVNLQQRIEDVRTFAGNTVTLSFWAKASATCTIEPYYIQNFGSGGSSPVSGSFGSSTLTTSWVRYSYTLAIPSVSGKTIGTSSYLNILTARITSATNVDVDTWGAQLEYGSKATPFGTATGNPQGELAACQRYYYRFGGNQVYEIFGNGIAASLTLVNFLIQSPTTMRTAPTSIDFSTLGTWQGGAITSISALVIASQQAGKNTISAAATTTGAVVNNPYILIANNSTSAYVGLSAEL